MDGYYVGYRYAYGPGARTMVNPFYYDSDADGKRLTREKAEKLLELMKSKDVYQYLACTELEIHDRNSILGEMERMPMNGDPEYMYYDEYLNSLEIVW